MLEEHVEAFLEYVEEYEKQAVADAIDGYPKDTRTLTLDGKQLTNKRPDLADDVGKHPKRVLRDFEDHVTALEFPHTEDLEGINVAVTSLPQRELGLSEIREEHQGTAITVRAQVGKVTDVRPRYEVAQFQCHACEQHMEVPAVAGKLTVPKKCGICESHAGLYLDEQVSERRDHQILELQPRPDEDAMNLQRSLEAHLWDRRVESVEAGDRVKVTGILKTEDAEPGKTVDARRPQYLDVLSVETEQQDFDSYDTSRVDEIKALAERDDLKDALIASFAPNILTGERGDTHKLAVMYQLFGGVTHHLDGGGRLRGDINILLIGAPGTGKSQYLTQANELAPKSVKVSGKGATAAGLTATATQPEFGDGWMLDAGALVMADGGMACIDEFDKMSESARKSMHEAMEDQEIPINKAGINTTLKSRTAVLAAANPEGGRFNRFDAVSEQINLGEALITRFDLVFALTDHPDADKDRAIAEHQYRVTNDGAVAPEIDSELLREYVAYARQNITPTFDNEETVELLVDKYVSIRDDNGNTEDAAVPVTARMNDSLRRLSQAAARAELSETVEPRHAREAIQQYQMTIGDIGLDEGGNIDAAKMAGNRPKSQQDRVEAITNLLTDNDGMDYEELVDAAPMDQSKVDQTLETLMRHGGVYEPQAGHYRAT